MKKILILLLFSFVTIVNAGYELTADDKSEMEHLLCKCWHRESSKRFALTNQDNEFTFKSGLQVRINLNQLPGFLSSYYDSAISMFVGFVGTLDVLSEYNDFTYSKEVTDANDEESFTFSVRKVYGRIWNMNYSAVLDQVIFQRQEMSVDDNFYRIVGFQPTEGKAEILHALLAIQEKGRFQYSGMFLRLMDPKG